MDGALWAKAHGAAVHFPVALTLCSAVLDAAAFALGNRPRAHDLRAAASCTILLAALGGIPAVASGLLMTRGEVLGSGALRLHHLFVWPAFALLLAAAAWRLFAGGRATRRAFAAYLAVAGALSLSMTTAAYWGGELLLASEAETTEERRLDPQLAARGRSLFLGSCAHCHGADAHGDEGPDLHGVQVSDRRIAGVITRGIKGEMPSFAKKLGADDIRALIAYVRSLD